MQIRKAIAVIIAAAALLTPLRAQDRAIPDGTYLFAQRDTCELFLDFYKAKDAAADAPTIVYMFGGGFKGGERNEESVQKWFTQLLQQGWNVASIDYRLGLKDVHGAGVSAKFIGQLENAIKIAVEDLYSATVYLVDNAGTLGIDPDRLILAGSSAGAISVLQAEWEISNGHSIADALPKGFNYAGVMAFSGAVFSRRGKAVFGKNACPVELFHGTVDKIVPYEKISVLRLHFDGSSQLAEGLKKNGQAYRIYRYSGHSHEIAGSMNYLMDSIEPFINDDVLGGKGNRIDETVNDSNIPVPDWAKEDYKSLY